jgi:hypothetical protein
MGNPISIECGKKLAAVLPKTAINMYWGGSIAIELRGGLTLKPAQASLARVIPQPPSAIAEFAPRRGR